MCQLGTAKLGCEVTALRCEANGHFPDHAPDPSQEAHLQTLRQVVMQQQADLGIALDGDGDRLVLVNEQGVIISADQLLCLFAEICMNGTKACQFVYDVKCSTLIRDTVQRLGGKTGDDSYWQLIPAKISGAVPASGHFGGEYAGHYVFNDGRGWGYDDGLYAALRVMEYLDQKGVTLSEALRAYPKRHGLKTYIFPLIRCSLLSFKLC